MGEGAFKDIKVLDLSEGIAGPYCTRLLGCLGAKVIKVERPGEGDKSRKMGPFPNDVPHPEKSALFLHLNINKKSITLNLEKGAGRKILQELVKKVDVLVESLHPGKMEKWGLAYADLEKIHPRLVMTSITPFGQTGPYRDFKATSAVLDALGGHTYVIGDPKREPIRYPEGTAEYSTGMFATVPTMGALFYAADNGVGQHIDVSIMECLAGLDWMRHARWTHLHVIQKRTGGRYHAWPGKIYPCRDGWVGLAGVGPLGTLVPMYSVIDVPELLDPKYESPASRAEHMEELDELVEKWLVNHDRYEVFNALQQARVQAGVCNTAEDLLKDPGFEARKFWVEIDHPKVGRLKYPGPLLLMSEMEWSANSAPLLGEHNKEIYHDLLGYPLEELTRLSQNGVI